MKLKEYYYVYRITNIQLNKHYIGYRHCFCDPINDIGFKYFSCSKDKEFKKDQILNKEHYTYTIIETFKTKEDALKLEIKLHNKFNVGINESFYNRAKQTSDGFDRTGIKHTDKVKRKISIFQRGRKTSDKTKKIMSDAKKGRIFSDEHKEKISIAQKGKIFSEEHKKNLSIARTGENNANAIKINIYNKKDEVIFNCNGGFKPFCSMNNLPYESFKKTYQKNTKLLFNLSGGRSRAFIDKYSQYSGWYARVII